MKTQGQEKRIWKHAARFTSAASKPIPSADPWGRKGQALGWAGVFRGKQTWLITIQAQRRGWREGWLQAGALTARTSARGGLAVSGTVPPRDCTKRHIC